MTKLEEKWSLTRETVGNGRLSVIMPVYNLAGSIVANLRETAELFAHYGVRAELIPVDDGSTDGTAEVLRRFAADWNRGEKAATDRTVVIAPVVCPKNGGKGAALRAGFDASTGDYVLLLDGDLDIHPKQTPWFFDQLVRKGADIVVGSKRHPRSVVQYPWHRRLVSWAYFTLVRLFVGLKVTDTQTGMKLFRRAVLGEALGRMLVKTYAFDLELLAIAHQRGAKIAEAPVVIRFGNKFGCLRPKTVKTMAFDSLAVFYRLRILNYYARAEVPRKLDHEPLVSIVIACPHPSWMLDECLKAIAAQTYRQWEVVVLPDEAGCSDCSMVRLNSSDGLTIEQSEQSNNRTIRFIATGKVRPAEKRNLGIKAARGEIIAFIDDDAYPEAHWLEYAVKYFSEPSIGAVGGPGVTPGGDPYLAKLGGRVYDNPLLSGNYRYRYKAGGIRRDVDDYPSCNLFVRKELLAAFGGYRTDFWPGEDTLLCKDIIDRGQRIVYDPWVVVYHHRRPLLLPHLRQLGRYAFHRGYFCKRYPSNSRHLAYFIPSLFVLYLLTCVPVAAALVGPWPAAMPAWLYCGLCAYVVIPLLAYFALVLVTSLSLNPLTWLLTAGGVFASHLVYGLRFVQGLSARKAPCEFIGKDHV